MMRHRGTQLETGKPARRGMASVLAMLYVTLIASLAVGFYAATNSAVQVTENEKRGTLSLASAESGMDFMRFQLSEVTIPGGTTQDQLFPTVYNKLRDRINNTGNMQGGMIISTDGNFIHIPSGTTDYLKCDATGGMFRATVENLGQKVRVKVYGKHGEYPARRAVRMEFDLAQNASDIFNYGIATKSRISMNSNAKIIGATDPTKGSILSTSSAVPTLQMEGNSQISGDVSFAGAGATLMANSNATISGYLANSAEAAEHVHNGVEAPEFPAVDASIFKPYATNVATLPKYDNRYLKNIRIPPNMNTIFDGSTVVEGVIYIETPNRISFLSNTVIRGVIVVQNNPIGTLASNTLTFDGNTRMEGVEALDPAVFGDLTKLTGSSILAPSFSIRFNSNFGTSAGSIVGSQIKFDSNARGTLKGTVICLSDAAVTFDGNSEITIASTGTTDYPAGVVFSSKYAALADTYEEVKP